jgi:predicted HicB family RNase H-like nuclease
MARKTETLNIRIDPDVKRRAQAAADADRRSLASLIEKLLDDYARGAERAKAERRK